ncbi:hypothetical protein SYK_01130 [Pseudodesulfovibrio nedwellii]|uniref:Uncharacterized protein n=1 Tax=Pseudodesulfovibrio nedwellii TaxID=2973072 RepID=A0ABM8AWF4_9BACT|nr:hypothetical protein [Pseudodesulfovibrio nedwellii]BDQ35753.1 hypothetical protein SYK_01130 [Pseudodesulfovibrio nedwellii]
MPVSIIKSIQTGIQSGTANTLLDAGNASAMRRKDKYVQPLGDHEL